MRRGFTMVELIIGLGLMMLLLLGSLTLLAGGMRSLQRTDIDTTMTDSNSRALRKITERIRQAMAVTITNSGNNITFNLPKMAAAADPVTGEQEIIVPPVSDGVTRGYVVNPTAGTLTDIETGKVLVRNVCAIDPEPTSSLYNQPYKPFQLNTVRKAQAITINIITRDNTGRTPRMMRMKTTAILRNVQ